MIRFPLHALVSLCRPVLQRSWRGRVHSRVSDRPRTSTSLAVQDADQCSRSDSRSRLLLFPKSARLRPDTQVDGGAIDDNDLVNHLIFGIHHSRYQ